MKTTAKVAALAAAGLIAAAPLATLPAFADGGSAHQAAQTGTQTGATATKTAAKTTPLTKAQDRALIRTSDHAYDALRNVRAARLAIFNGDLKLASASTGAALDDMKKADSEDAKLSVKLTGKADQYLPVDTSISLSDGFVPTPEKMANIKKANEHMAKGQTKDAAEVLKLANIDVTVQAALVPTRTDVTKLEHAASLLKDGKYYQANLALKAVEDSVVFNSYGLDSVPAQG